VKQIIIEIETPGDSRSMFNLRINERVIGNNLTAAQAHVLVGEILARISVARPEGSAITGM
jgi:hypothetical protein